MPAAGTASRTTAAAESAKSRALPRASATWIGATYIFANDWYKGDGQTYNDWSPTAFQGANLGKVSGSISFGGECQTYGEGDGEGNPARACYNVLSGGIASLEQIQELLALKPRAPYGCISGKAIYEGRISVKEAVKLCCS